MVCGEEQSEGPYGCDRSLGAALKDPLCHADLCGSLECTGTVSMPLCLATESSTRVPWVRLLHCGSGPTLQPRSAAGTCECVTSTCMYP